MTEARIGGAKIRNSDATTCNKTGSERLLHCACIRQERNCAGESM